MSTKGHSCRHVTTIAVSVSCVLVVVIVSLPVFATALPLSDTVEDVANAGPEFPVEVLLMPAVLGSVLITFEVIRRKGLVLR